MPRSPLDRLEMTFHGRPDADAEAPHLSVDGMTESGPNLSHWPGNRTPAAYKADLSTGICLRFVRAPVAEQEQFLRGVDHVLNDHYDTDGFLSLLAITRPDVALAREELCLCAAATGDFQVFSTDRAFAIDRIVVNLADPERSPIASEFKGLEPADKSWARYRWLIDHAERVLDEPASLAVLYEEELAAVRAELDACLRGAVERERFAELGVAVVRSSAPVRRMTLNTLAGAWRVLHVETDCDGPGDRGRHRYRYHDRTESWFELATFHPPPRRDLRPLARRLQQLEQRHRAGSDAAAGGDAEQASWCADPPTEPIPELYFGPPSSQAYGQLTRELALSRLDPAVVQSELLGFFAAPLDQEK